MIRVEGGFIPNPFGFINFGFVDLVYVYDFLFTLNGFLLIGYPSYIYLLLSYRYYFLGKFCNIVFGIEGLDM